MKKTPCTNVSFACLCIFDCIKVLTNIISRQRHAQYFEKKHEHRLWRLSYISKISRIGTQSGSLPNDCILYHFPSYLVRHNGVMLKMRQKCIWYCANIKITFKGIPQNSLQFFHWVARSLIVVFTLVHNCICCRLQELHQEKVFQEIVMNIESTEFWQQFAELIKSKLENWKRVRCNIIWFA